MPGQHIILLLDGTDCSASGGFRRHFSNAFRFSPTLGGERSIKIVEEVLPNGEMNREECLESHVVLYFPGPGTRKVPLRRLNMLTGFETNQIVKEAYISLCTNIIDIKADKLYIIGYSRGAAAEKILVALINDFGILKAADIHKFGNIWAAFYRNDRKRKKFSRPTQSITIPFVGLFDPVSGPEIGRNRYKISDVIDGDVKNAVEILSIDERRRLFFPRFWTLPNISADDVVAQRFTPGSALQQIWAPGSHGDIGHPGGGNVIADIAFLSMIERFCFHTNLKINVDYIRAIYNNLASGTNAISIKCKGWKLVWRKRTIPSSTSTEIHPLYFSLKNNQILMNGRSTTYGEGYQNVDNFRVYDFNIDAIFQENGATAKINDSVMDRLGQQV